jgi:hypothetical protein
MVRPPILLLDGFTMSLLFFGPASLLATRTLLFSCLTISNGALSAVFALCVVFVFAGWWFKF